MTNNKKFMKAYLPNFFSFKHANDLIRIGKDYDGGYLVSKLDIEKSDVLIGLGISDDWSFEKDFLSLKNIEVYAYDASISKKYFFKKIVRSIIRLDNLKDCLYWLKKFWNYTRFFSQNNVSHIQKFVGLNSESHTYCKFTEVLNEKNHKNIFLKIDVEGSEYRFLDEILENQDRITGMVIELHDCDIHLKKIKWFINNFGLSLVHIHANNYAPIRSDDSLPLVLELTFSKYAKFSNSSILPHKLDMPNNKNVTEIKLFVMD